MPGARDRGLGLLLTTIEEGWLVVLTQSEADIRNEQERSAGLDSKDGEKTVVTLLAGVGATVQGLKEALTDAVT